MSRRRRWYVRSSGTLSRRSCGRRALSAADVASATRGPSVYSNELSGDPKRIPFAFGGVDPGRLHAHGQLHATHKCTYSVGRAGKYLLHVHLRSYKQMLVFHGVNKA